MCKKKKVINVKIVPGCISCGTCEAVCPAVFEVKGIAEVRPNPDLVTHGELVKEAADICPVNVIQVEESEEQ